LIKRPTPTGIWSFFAYSHEACIITTLTNWTLPITVTPTSHTTCQSTRHLPVNKPECITSNLSLGMDSSYEKITSAMFIVTPMSKTTETSLLDEQ